MGPFNIINISINNLIIQTLQRNLDPLLNFKMALSILESGILTLMKEKVWVNKFGQMGRYMRAFGTRIRQTVKEDSFILMETSMKAIG